MAIVLAFSLAVAASAPLTAASCYTGKVPLPSSPADRAATPCCCGGDWSCCFAKDDGEAGSQRPDQEPAPSSNDNGRVTVLAPAGLAAAETTPVRDAAVKQAFAALHDGGFAASRAALPRHLQLSILTS